MGKKTPSVGERWRKNGKDMTGTKVCVLFDKDNFHDYYYSSGFFCCLSFHLLLCFSNSTFAVVCAVCSRSMKKQQILLDEHGTRSNRPYEYV